MNDDQLVRLFRLGMDPVGKRSPSCPSESEIVAFANAQLSAGPRERLEHHIADCPFCLGQVGFVIRSEELEAPTEVPADLVALATRHGEVKTDGRRTVAWNWRLFTTAAAAAAFAGVVWLGVTDRPGLDSEPLSTPPTVRDGTTIIQSPAISWPQEGNVIDPRAEDIRWSSVPGAASYRVSIVTAEGDLLWEGQVDSTQTQIPAELDLGPGRDYFVWIDAHLHGGAMVTSPVIGFRVAPH